MKEDRQKKIFLMKVGVSFFVALILVLWILNLQNVWKINKLNSPIASSSNWAELRADFDQLSTDLNKRLEKFKEAKEVVEATSPLASSSLENVAGNNLVKELIANTNNLIASNTPIATNSPVIINTDPLGSTTSPTTNLTSNCPQYINCLPSVGEAPPCQIPAGCEGITIIAY